MRTLGDAERFLQRTGKPVVVKPNSGTGGGNGVTTGITDAAEKVTYLPAVAADGSWKAKLAPGTYHAPKATLAVTEARRLYPTVVVLESLAVRQMPPLDDPTLDLLTMLCVRLEELPLVLAVAARTGADELRPPLARLASERAVRRLALARGPGDRG